MPKQILIDYDEYLDLDKSLNLMKGIIQNKNIRFEESNSVNYSNSKRVIITDNEFVSTLSDVFGKEITEIIIKKESTI